MIKSKVPLTHSNKTEILFDGPSVKIKSMEDVDTLAKSMNSPTVVVHPDYFERINTIRQVTGSPYSIIVAVDMNGKQFGINKILVAKNLIQADGFEVGITTGKKLQDIKNELKSISNFMSNMSYDIRWVINASGGKEFIENAIKAIKEQKLDNIITIKDDSDMSYDIIKFCREKLGKLKAEIKICSRLHDKLLRNDPNLKYLIPINDLM